jgi:hypothetical protein
MKDTYNAAIVGRRGGNGKTYKRLASIEEDLSGYSLDSGRIVEGQDQMHGSPLQLTRSDSHKRQRRRFNISIVGAIVVLLLWYRTIT